MSNLISINWNPWQWA